VLNQVYANVFNKPVLVPTREVTGLGSVILAFLAAGIFPTIEEAQKAVCPPFRTVAPLPSAVAVYEQLFPIFHRLYYAFGKGVTIQVNDVLSVLRRLAVDKGHQKV